MNNFMGKGGFVWWQGVVEDRIDPLFLGRCRVRILGWDTEDKTRMPTNELPWAYPVQPITSAAQTGVGISPTGVVEGTWVVGFYRDGNDAQERVFFGTLGGIPGDTSPNPNSNKGFYDPRRSLEELPPAHPDAQKVGLIGADSLLDNDTSSTLSVPTAPVSIEYYRKPDLKNGQKLKDLETNNPKFNYHESPLSKGFGNLTVPHTLTAIVTEFAVRSRYPDQNYLGEPTTPRSARGAFGVAGLIGLYTGNGILQEKEKWRLAFSSNIRRAKASDASTWEEPASDYATRYPYNHVHQTESGHLFEIDDTPGAERLHRYHRMGTFEEIGALGQRITKIANQDFKFCMSNYYEQVHGDYLLNVSNDLDIVSTGYYHNTGTMDMNSSGGVSIAGSDQTYIGGKGGVTIDAGSGPVVMRGSSFHQEIVSAENTVKTKGNSSTETGGSHSIKGGSLNFASLGGASVSAGGAMTVISDNVQESCMNLAGIAGAPARSFKATNGNIDFETLLPSPVMGAFNFNAGLAGLLGSISMDFLGQISLNMGPKGSVAKITLGASGIELSYLAGLASIKLDASGVSINGLKVEMIGVVTAKVDAPAKVDVGSTATAMTNVKGTMVMIN
jgi:hypothetical protein